MNREEWAFYRQNLNNFKAFLEALEETHNISVTNILIELWKLQTEISRRAKPEEETNAQTDKQPRNEIGETL